KADRRAREVPIDLPRHSSGHQRSAIPFQSPLEQIPTLFLRTPSLLDLRGPQILAARTSQNCLARKTRGVEGLSPCLGRQYHCWKKFQQAIDKNEGFSRATIWHRICEFAWIFPTPLLSNHRARGRLPMVYRRGPRRSRSSARIRGGTLCRIP